jgi:YHS domain-containing protein
MQKAENAMIEATSNPSIPRDHSAVQRSESGRSGESTDQPALVADMSAQTLIDPVCGMTVTVDSPHVLQHKGMPVYFCSSGCKSKFMANPAKYQVAGPVSKAPTPPATERTVDGAIYTCPMHPQIRQVGPGNCPICGMTLEPVTATAAVGPNRELVDMTRRFWVGLILTLPVFILEMGAHIPGLGLHDLVPPRISTWIQFALSTPVVLWAGWPVFERAWASVVHRSLNMFSLIALGTGAAYLYSLFATFAPGMFPAGFRGMGGEVSVYFEAAAVITVLVLLGQVLECAPASRPAVQSVRCSNWHRKLRTACGLGATTRKWHLSWFRSAIISAYGPVMACRSTAKFSRARVSWMNRWSLVSRCLPPSS